MVYADICHAPRYAALIDVMTAMALPTDAIFRLKGEAADANDKADHLEAALKEKTEEVEHEKSERETLERKVMVRNEF